MHLPVVEGNCLVGINCTYGVIDHMIPQLKRVSLVLQENFIERHPSPLHNLGPWVCPRIP